MISSRSRALASGKCNASISGKSSSKEVSSRPAASPNEKRTGEGGVLYPSLLPWIMACVFRSSPTEELVQECKPSIHLRFRRIIAYSSPWGRAAGPGRRTDGIVTDCRHPCKSFVKRKREFSTRAPESAHFVESGPSAAQQRLTASGSCVALQNRTSICSLRLRRVRTDD
jgi:hypothetical protein